MRLRCALVARVLGIGRRHVARRPRCTTATLFVLFALTAAPSTATSPTQHVYGYDTSVGFAQAMQHATRVGTTSTLHRTRQRSDHGAMTIPRPWTSPSSISAFRAAKEVDAIAPKLGSRGGPGTGSRHIPEDVKRQEIEASKGLCRECKQPVEPASGSPLSREFDHAWPYSRGGDTTFENIQSLCRTCNRRKGSKTTQEFETGCSEGADRR